MTIPRTPLFFVEIDASIVTDSGLRIPLMVMDVQLPGQTMSAGELDRQSRAATVGQAAKQLHVLAHVEKSMHEAIEFKAYVFKTRHGFYDFDFVRSSRLASAIDKRSNQLVATLTVLSDHRIMVDYHDSKQSEILYL